MIEPWRFVVANKSISIEVAPVLATNEVDVCLRAAVKGVGLCWVARSIARPYIELGGLDTVLDAYATPLPPLALYYPSRSQSSPKLRAFVEVAKAKMRQRFGQRRPSKHV
jgi:DNA-binding transcriptional LysR family regulator